MPPTLVPNPQTSAAIDDCVERLLKDLGNPPPPLRLEDVRELLRLDLKYYSSTDTNWLQDRLHHVRIAGKQIIARPRLLLDVVKKLDLRALILPDRGRILVDDELPKPKKRWCEAHEVVHKLLPWHDGAAFGDRDRTLHPASHQLIESEANYGAGRLLFLGSQFIEQVRSASMDMDAVKEFAKAFGNSLTTTLWRVVENLDEPAVGLVSIHPHEQPKEAQPAIRYFIRSRRFAKQFTHLSDADLFSVVSRVVYRRGGGPIGSREVVLVDVDGEEHVFWFECFNNTHDTLTLGTYRCARVVLGAAS